MNNGLNGRYLSQLKEWNQARKIASELVDAFYKSAVSSVVSEWKTSVNFPSQSEIKSLLTDVLFLSDGESINQIARSIMEWGEPERPKNRGHPAMAA